MANWRWSRITKPYMNIVDIIFIILRHFIYSIYYKQFQSSSLKVVSAEEKLSFNFTFESYGWERSYGFLALWREVEDSEERGASDSDNYFVSYPATFIQGKDPFHSPKLYQSNHLGWVGFHKSIREVQWEFVGRMVH